MRISGFLAALALLTAIPAISQTYVVMVRPVDSKEWGYINLEGEYLIQPKYRKGAPFSPVGLAPVQDPDTKNYVFIKLNGEKLQTEIEDFHLMSMFGFGIKGFKDGRVPVKKDKKWGYLNAQGKLIIPLMYDDVTEFDFGYAIVERNEKFFIIDKRGTETPLRDPKIVSVKEFSEGLAPFESPDKKLGFINIRGEIIIEPQYDAVGYFSNGLAWARDNSGKIGYINKQGEWAISPQFDAVKDFPKGASLARVRKGDTWTYVNTSGEIINIPISDINDFHDGLSIGKKGEKVGFYNTSGDWAIEPKFDAVRDFHNGYAAARQGENWGVIDKTGNWVVKPMYDNIKDVEKVN